MSNVLHDVLCNVTWVTQLGGWGVDGVADLYRIAGLPAMVAHPKGVKRYTKTGVPVSRLKARA
jgi:hypothetical protein